MPAWNPSRWVQRPAAPFALGVEPGLADICIAGQVVTAQYVKLGLDDFPAVARLTERGATRADDRISEAGMEDRKRQGYF